MTRRAVDKRMFELGAWPSGLPAALAPQLPTLVARPPAGGDWVYEIKFDGYRFLARIDSGRVRLLTRSGQDWTAKLPAVATALLHLPVTSAWLDGEIVALSEDGIPDFSKLQNAFGRDQAPPWSSLHSTACFSMVMTCAPSRSVFAGTCCIR